jgi:hypothetical protein
MLIPQTREKHLLFLRLQKQIFVASQNDIMIAGP